MVRFLSHERPTRTDKVTFVDGSSSDYAPPINTVDPRYRACTEHRVGCDCREADLREEIVELKAVGDEFRAENARLRALLAEVGATLTEAAQR